MTPERLTIKSALAAAKAAKLARIEPLLRTDMPSVRSAGMADFLTADLRAQFDIVDTDNVSSNNYDGQVLGMIERHRRRNRPRLWRAAGGRCTSTTSSTSRSLPTRRPTCAASASRCPFVDGAFDAVISIAVLEHVKDPFRCAREIARVLKPGGEIICCVPFLQPYHGYPHQYYNMTHQGIANLFSDSADGRPGRRLRQRPAPSGRCRRWCRAGRTALSGEALEEFKALRVADLMQPASTYLGRPVRHRPVEGPEPGSLAAATVLFAHKPR